MTNTLCTLLIESAARFPEREAVIQGKTRISYRSLSAWASSTADYLRSSGFRRGERVGILLQNSAEYVAVYYGVLAAGGVTVSLNTAARARDLCNWLRHSEVTWLFADVNHAEYRATLLDMPAGIRIVEVGEADSAGTASPHASLAQVLADEKAVLEAPEQVQAGDLASIIYTSGTTGRPKGVMLSHANLYSNTRSILDYLGLQHTDRVMNVLPFYYSYGNSVLHTHIAAGASIVLENSMLYPQRVLEQLVEYKATGFSGVPSTYSLLLRRSRLAEFDLSSLRYLTQAGGAMSADAIQRMRRFVPGADFFVMYGQTEASARLSYVPPGQLDAKPGSIGIAISGVNLELRDRQARRVKQGDTGEIWAAGENIMLGYWREPEMTAAVLADGWLRTGDLAYQDEDGYFYLVGRASDMIKSGAHRISPQEIEEVLLELDGIKEAAAVGVDDELLGQVIKVAVVPEAGSGIDKRSLLAHCRQNLAIYKIPKIVEFVDHLPKTASGKISRYKLREQTKQA